MNLPSLQYGVWNKKLQAWDAAFSDLSDAFLWADSEPEKENFQVRYIATGFEVPRQQYEQHKRAKRKTLQERLGKV